MLYRRHLMAAMVVAGIMSYQSATAVDISIDQSTAYQTIEGFGAFGSIKPWKEKQGPFYADVDLEAVGFYDSIVNELGATMIRTNIDYDFNPEPGVFTITDGMRTRLQRLAKLQETAWNRQEPIKFIASCWSPPWWMKVGKCISHNASEINPDGVSCDQVNNTLDQALYLDDYAVFINEWVRTVKDSFGIDLYAVSLQNEPAFNEPYASCNYYNGDNYNSMFKAVAPDVHSTHPDLKLFGVEHMGWTFPSWEEALNADNVSKQHMHAWAIHGYYDGVLADTGFYSSGSPGDKPLWMSETSGSSYGTGLNDWGGGMSLAKNILRYLKHARLTAWTWWSLQDIVCTSPVGCEASEAGHYCLVMNGSPTAKYYASSHFYRFIRPGATQVSSTSNDGDVLVVAFKHQEHNCLSIVLHNSGGGKTVDVTGTDVPGSFEMHVSTLDNKRVKSDVGRTGIAIPGNSVVTLVSGQYSATEPAAASEPNAKSIRPGFVARRVLRSEYYTLLGKRVPRSALRMAGSHALILRRDICADGAVVERVLRVGR
ncbi:MAG: hypothetical protein GF331_25960 [Chitinivibrionales bacterium]|nr:hypothetical protein [Chitinivibrionales bacterium]